MATVIKPSYYVRVSTLGGMSIDFDDSVFPGVGKMAWDALQRQMDITAQGMAGDDPVTYFVPFHAVDFAELKINQAEVEKPEDVNCPTEEEEP